MATNLHPTMNAILTNWRALPLHRCSMCSGQIQSAKVVVLGDQTFHPSCAVTSAAGIAASVLDGDDSETAHDTMQAAGILAEAARVLAARVGGRA